MNISERSELPQGLINNLASSFATFSQQQTEERMGPMLKSIFEVVNRFFPSINEQTFYSLTDIEIMQTIKKILTEIESKDQVTQSLQAEVQLAVQINQEWQQTKTQLKTFQNENNTLKVDNHILRTKYNQLESSNSTSGIEIQQLKTDKAFLISKNNQLETAISTRENQINVLTNQITELKAEIQNAHGMITKFETLQKENSDMKTEIQSLREFKARLQAILPQ